MYRHLTTLLFSYFLCAIFLLNTTQVQAQVPAPATLCDGASVTYCASAVETPCLATCPVGTTLIATSLLGILTSEPSALFPADPTRILPPLSPVGLTTYTIVCVNSSGNSSPTVVDVTILGSPSAPIITSNVPSQTAGLGATVSLTASCPTGSMALWSDDDPFSPVFLPIRTITAPSSATVLTYEAICQTASRCASQPQQITITVADQPGSPTLTLGPSATFCVPTESCGGVFYYNLVQCPMGYQFSYRDPTGLLIAPYTQSGPVLIPYAPTGTHPMPRILNFTVFCTNTSNGQITSAPLTIYVGEAPAAPSLQIFINR